MALRCPATLLSYPIITVANLLRDAGLVCSDRVANLLRDGGHFGPKYARNLAFEIILVQNRFSG